MAISHNLGFPRIGEQRELKRALEQYWRGEQNAAALEQTAAQLRKRHWLAQRDAGIDLIPVGDFSLYDHMLDMSALLGTLPLRFGEAEEELSLERYFAMARGTAEQPALEMTKWFDTNYHYLVPELSLDTEFNIGSTRLFSQIAEAQALGLRIKPVLVGPLTYLYLSKTRGADFNRLHLLQRLLPVYQSILQRIAATGVEWVQLDEPALALDLPPDWLAALDRCYADLAMPDGEASCKILLATYFGDVSEHCARLKALPVAGLHLDLCRAPQQLQKLLPRYPRDKVLSLGVVDGRNIWRADLERIYTELQHAREYLGDRLWVAPSCSLLHAPIDLRHEKKFDPELRSWLAFGLQKLEEVALLTKGLNEGRSSIASALEASSAAQQTRKTSARIHDAKVQQRVQALSATDSTRHSAFAARQPAQRKRFALPPFPTTSIGSFPQTPEIRHVRAAFKRGDLARPDYVAAIQAQIRLAIEKQEALGIDVLVHGEAERNDMVEYFGERLSGFAFSENGWVQSYGSRCVKPPIIYGDVSRPEAMTVEWFKYAQSLSSKPVKGMLTGPVTILQWSFVRDDQPRELTAKQIALAIRDEVGDLEQAGAGMVQIDEPAFREGLPLKRAQWAEYLAWATEAFRISASGVRDDTQIHTHMCYSEFNDILPSIAALDADVITIETSRSDMELLGAFGDFKYPNEIGPGVYDIHSPRVPDYEEMLRLLRKACTVVDPHNLWVNPDCGLKTRAWLETEAALRNMVKAARQLREEFPA